jgi:hypothetical protein
MTRSARKQGYAAHERAADAENMDVHEGRPEQPAEAEAEAEAGTWRLGASERRILSQFVPPTTRSYDRAGFLKAAFMSASKPRQQQMRQRIAAAAARLMAEDGIDDYAHAKRKAARQLGAEATQALPGNEEIEEHLRTYQSLYQGEEQRARLQFLRRQALEIMGRLQAFRPHLCGPVLKGTAGRYSEIDLQLFTDDAKAVELFLLNQGIAYDVAEHRHNVGDQLRAVSVLQIDWQGVRANIAVFAANDERALLRTSPTGRPIERAAIAVVAQLLNRNA